MNTDKERFLRLFEDFGIELCDYINDDGSITFEMSPKTPNVEGYGGFVAEFIFDKEGNFKNAGVWE